MKKKDWVLTVLGRLRAILIKLTKKKKSGMCFLVFLLKNKSSQNAFINHLWHCKMPQLNQKIYLTEPRTLLKVNHLHLPVLSGCCQLFLGIFVLKSHLLSSYTMFSPPPRLLIKNFDTQSFTVLLFITPELTQQVNNSAALCYMSQDTGQTKSHMTSHHYFIPPKGKQYNLGQ